MKHLPIYIIICLLSFRSMGQITVFYDDFSSNGNTSWTTSGPIGSSSWSVSRSGVDWGARINSSPAQLELTNDASTSGNVNGWVFVYTQTSNFSAPYNPTLYSNIDKVTWFFNLRQIRTDPAGFGSGYYGVALILATNSINTFNNGSGYAIVLGQSGTTDPIRLAKFNNGLGGTLSNIIVSNTTGLTDIGNEYISGKVTYDPSSNTWELFLRNDGNSSFADPTEGQLTSQGIATDNTYTGSALSYMGAYWQGSTAANQTAFFDNIVIQVSGYKGSTNGGGLWNNSSTWDPQGTPVKWDGVKIKTGHTVAVEMEIFSGFNIDLQNGQTLTVGSLTTNNLLTLEDGASLICGSTNGAVTLKRNIAGTNQFHLISSPVSGAVVGNVFPASQYNTLWLREYNEPTGSWVNKTIADNFATGKGYSLITTDASTTATFVGNLVNTDQNLTLSYQGTSGNTSYDGYNLLGNPFSSALDRDLGNWNPTNVEPAVYVFDNGNYRSWNGTGTLTDGIIPLGQGFFMKAQANNGTVTLPAAARVHSNQAFYKSSPVNTLRVDVSSVANAYTDALVIRYAEGASAQYDAAYDARKLSGLADAPEIWCPGEVSTSLNTLPSIEENPEVSIAFKPAAEALHTLSFSGLESFEYSGPILLTDLLTGSRIDLRHQTKYEFMASPSQPENRFKLTFASVGIDEPQALNGVNAWYQDGIIRLAQLPTTPCQAELYSTDGKLLLSARVMPTQNQIPVLLKSAVYILRLSDGNQVRNIKFIVK